MSDNDPEKSFPFLRLPPEIRLMIYPLIWGNLDYRQPKFPPIMSHMCREIRTECLPVFFQEANISEHIFIERPDGTANKHPRKNIPAAGELGSIQMGGRFYGKTLTPKLQLLYKEWLEGSIREIYVFISTNDDGGLGLGGLDRYRAVCSIEINLPKISSSDPPKVIIRMEDYTCEGGEASIEGEEPWVEGEPEYEFGHTIEARLMAVLLSWPKPLHYSAKLLRVLLDTMVEVQREICPDGERVIEGIGSAWGEYVDTD